jgi:hypothetical protein
LSLIRDHFRKTRRFLPYKYCCLIILLLIFTPLASCSAAESASTALEISPTPTVPGPHLLEPSDGATFAYPQNITLEWAWDRPLGQYEFYDVRVWREGEPAYGITWSPVGELHLDSWLAGQNQAGVYHWQIAVIAGRDGILEKQVSEPSPVYSFTLENAVIPTVVPTPSQPTAAPPEAELTEEERLAIIDRYSAPLADEIMDAMEREFRNAYAEHQQRYAFDESATSEELEALGETIRSDFMTWLEAPEHEPTIDNISLEPLETNDVYRLSRITFTNASGFTVRGILSLPIDDDKTYPVMIIPNGTSSSSNEIFGLTFSDYHFDAGRVFAEDYIVFALDIPYTQNKNSFLFSNAAGVNWAYDQLCDKVSSALDYVATQDTADMERVGIYGISLGGWVSVTASLCDDRITAAATSGTNVLTSFLTHLTEHRRLVYPEQYQYRIAYRPDFYEAMYALYPRLVIIELNQFDKTGVYEEALANAQKVQQYYALRGQGENVRLSLFSGQRTDNGHYMQPEVIKAIFDEYFGI